MLPIGRIRRMIMGWTLLALLAGWLPPATGHAQSHEWAPVDLAAWQACAARGMCRATPLPGAFTRLETRWREPRVMQEWPDRSRPTSSEGLGASTTWIPRPRCTVQGQFRWYPSGEWHILAMFAAVWNGGAWQRIPVAMGWGFLTDAAESCPGTWVVARLPTDAPPPWIPPRHDPDVFCENDLSDGFVPGVPLRLAVRDPQTGREQPVSAPYWSLFPAPGAPPHRVIYPVASVAETWNAPVTRGNDIIAPERVRLAAPSGHQLVAIFDLPGTRFADPRVRSVTLGAIPDAREMALIIQDLGRDRQLATPDDRFFFAQSFSSHFGDIVAYGLVPLADWPFGDWFGLSAGSTYTSVRYIHDQRLTFLAPPTFREGMPVCLDTATCDYGRLRLPMEDLRIAFPIEAGRSYRIAASIRIRRCTDGGSFHIFGNTTQLVVDVEDGITLRGTVLDVSRPDQATLAQRAAHTLTLDAWAGGQYLRLDQQTTGNQGRALLQASLARIVAALEAQRLPTDDATPVDLQVRMTLGQPAGAHQLQYAWARHTPAQAPPGVTVLEQGPDRVRWRTTLGRLRQGGMDEVTFFVVSVPPFSPPSFADAVVLEFLPPNAARSADAPVLSTDARADPVRHDWLYGAVLAWRPALRLTLPPVWRDQGYQVQGAITAWEVQRIGATEVQQRLAATAWHRVAWGKAGWQAPAEVWGAVLPTADGTPQPLAVRVQYEYWLLTPFGAVTEPQRATLTGAFQVVIHAPHLRP